MTVGEKIRELRKKARLTQKELGKLSNTSETTIKQYELGKRQPRLEQLKRIAKVLNIYVGELLADNYEEYKEQIIADFSNTVSRTSENATTTIHTLYEDAEKSNRMNGFFEMLNSKGQDKAIDQVELLTKIPEYRKEPDEPQE